MTTQTLTRPVVEQNLALPLSSSPISNDVLQTDSMWGDWRGQRSVYIAGPMRGYELFNFPSFDQAAAMMRKLGFVVLSPAEHDRAVGFDEHLPIDEQPSFDVTRAFRWDLQSLLEVDAVYFLEDYELSQGARCEHAVAVALGLQRIYQVPRDESSYLYMQDIAMKRPDNSQDSKSGTEC